MNSRFARERFVDINLGKCASFESEALKWGAKPFLLVWDSPRPAQARTNNSPGLDLMHHVSFAKRNRPLSISR